MPEANQVADAWGFFTNPAAFSLSTAPTRLCRITAHMQAARVWEPLRSGLLGAKINKTGMPYLFTGCPGSRL